MPLDRTDRILLYLAALTFVAGPLAVVSRLIF